jgi:hypothetical protein
MFKMNKYVNCYSDDGVTGSQSNLKHSFRPLNPNIKTEPQSSRNASILQTNREWEKTMSLAFDTQIY